MFKTENNILVCACTPSTAETTSITPSNTLRDRSTSAIKSAWPGVSIKLIFKPWATKETTDALIVMPLFRSNSIASVCVFPWSTFPSSLMTCVSNKIRSAKLVFPASTCARIPIFIVCIRENPLFFVHVIMFLSNMIELPHYNHSYSKFVPFCVGLRLYFTKKGFILKMDQNESSGHSRNLFVNVYIPS